MSFLFGSRKTPAELLRENKRMLDKSIREIERERQGLQTQEKKLILEIKKNAKQGQMGEVRVMAKDLIRTRHQIGKFYKLKSQLQGVALRIQRKRKIQNGRVDPTTHSFSRADQIKYVVFACLLLLLKLEGIVAKKVTADNDSEDLVVSFSSSAPQIKYDLFLNFRGADIREGFLSHLNKTLYQKQIFPFVDDMLPKGCEILEDLLGAIERSLISLVIFSQNYASSSWCLLELVKILECKEKDGQIVLPVFYKVDPSQVRHQKGAYKNAFSEHEKRHSLIKLQTWRSALKETANLEGFHSSNFRNEAELVEEIVKWVQKRLKHVHQVNSKGFVGIAKPISHVESLLRLESEDVRVIGIWGMGGIGKTTIAEEVYNRLHADYEGFCFLANVREELGRQGIISLKTKLFSTLLGEQDLKIETPNVLPTYVEKRLRRMKVLIVLDDVNDSEQLESLVGTKDRFKNGSRIIITTRDKQVLAKWVDDIYEVQALDFDESFRLFNLNAFEHNHIDREYYELSKSMVEYAKGVPVVLKVLGHLLRGKDKEIWESQSKRLKKVPNKKVHDVIKISIDDDLDHDEKKIFLDIACFFDGLNLNVDKIKLLLKDRDYSVAAELERLKDKALITISQENIVSMHNIIQETAWEMVRQESIEDPGHRSRLLDADDIYQVLKNNKGSEAIRSIVLNSSMNQELQLSPQVFAKMSKLQFLDLYCDWPYKVLYLPQGLESLPNELRYLRWAFYPLESLPSKFSAENLVELNLPYSRVKKLWHQVQELENLNTLVLHSSTSLVELPDFSKATNLKVIDLRFCLELTSVHPSVFSINKLEKLDLGGCISLSTLGSNIHLSSLRFLSLNGTGIKQLPSSIELQSKLEKLNLAYTYIENLPASIKHLTKLRHLDIQHCRELPIIPELPPSLEILDASGCISLDTVLFPSTASEQLNENKKRVAFWNCLKLDEHSLKAIALNAQVNMMKFAFQHLSTFGRDYDAQITNVYRGSRVLLYVNTTCDFLPIDFCFTLQSLQLDYILEEHPVRAIRLNALVHQHLSTVGHSYDAQSTYVYPGSKVPEWLVYGTTQDSLTIDLSFPPHSPEMVFIFCFIVPQVQSEGLFLKFKISVGEDEGNTVYLDRPHHGIISDHVYLMYDQGCSSYLNSQAKHQPRFKIKVTAASRTLTSQYVPLQLRGFGVSPIDASQYLSFLQQIFE